MKRVIIVHVRIIFANIFILFQIQKMTLPSIVIISVVSVIIHNLIVSLFVAIYNKKLKKLELI